MKMMFKAFSKNLFGVKYERMTRIVFIYLVVFWGLSIGEFQVPVAPFVFYLMVSTFTAGVMWQALSSEDNAVNMQNMVMLPFERRDFVLSYTAAIGTYTILTKTAALFAVLLAVSVREPAEILGGILCTVNAALMAAAIFSVRKYWYAGALWAAAVLVAIFAGWDEPWFLPMLSANGFLAFLLLQSTDGYAFYLQEGKSGAAVKGRRRHSVWVYFFRYMKSHKNYIMNTVIMWGAACVLPIFFKQMESPFVIPLGFAILSLNTPVCILLSCDHTLEQAVRFLPGQKKIFCVPYCLFIFLCNISADAIFLVSWQVHIGGVTLPILLTALFFAMQSAIFSVLLEWICPVRGWKIESDLWHHPRKYIVPAGMLLLAGVVGTVPMLLFPLLVFLLAEIAVLLIQCRR